MHIMKVDMVETRSCSRVWPLALLLVTHCWKPMNAIKIAIGTAGSTMIDMVTTTDMSTATDIVMAIVSGTIIATTMVKNITDITVMFVIAVMAIRSTIEKK